jgi:hypothetical protein
LAEGLDPNRKRRRHKRRRWVPNCNAWQNGVTGTGTVGELDGAQPINDTVVATEHGWEVLSTFCDSARFVWCVEDD